jgi:hypothetical protein
MAQGKTTGSNQSDFYIHYAKLNLARMNRLDKTITLTDSLKDVLKKVTQKYVFLVITEGWCGDAAQNIPILDFITKENPNIELKLILRDENLELMDRYLTDGGRSIPKLICLTKKNDTATEAAEADTTYEEIFTWGPRPEAAQKIMLHLKEKNATLDEKALAIHAWYNADKTLSAQKELENLIEMYLL